MSTQSLIISVLIPAAMLAACHRTSGNQDSTQVPEITVANPEIDSLVLHKSYPGYVSAINETQIVSRVNGYIVGKKFTDGTFVKAGQPLFIIESTSYRDEVNQAEAALQSAIAQNDYASKQYEAMKRALESDAVSKMDVNQAESNMRETEAAIKTARSRLESARTMLGYCTTRAPYDCYVAKPLVDVNDYVAGEGSPVTLVTVYDNSRLHVNFSIENDTFLALKQNAATRNLDLDHIPVSFSDSITAVYYGKLDYESPAVDKSTGTVTLRLIIANPDNELKSGMYANISLPYAVEPDAVVVRDASLGTDQLGKYLYVVNDSDQVVYTPVKAGELYHDTLRVITSGLKPSDRYVTQALLKVRDGMKIKPVSAK